VNFFKGNIQLSDLNLKADVVERQLQLPITVSLFFYFLFSRPTEKDIASHIFPPSHPTPPLPAPSHSHLQGQVWRCRQDDNQAELVGFALQANSGRAGRAHTACGHKVRETRNQSSPDCSGPHQGLPL
jgi:hypothetical protein